MVESFKYRVDGNHPAVTLACLAALLVTPDEGTVVERGMVNHCLCMCALVWIHDPVTHWLSHICVACWPIGLFVVNFSVVWEHGLAPARRSEVARNSAFHMAHRSFPLSAVRDFGFGVFSHIMARFSEWMWMELGTCWQKEYGSVRRTRFCSTSRGAGWFFL